MLFAVKENGELLYNTLGDSETTAIRNYVRNQVFLDSLASWNVQGLEKSGALSEEKCLSLWRDYKKSSELSVVKVKIKELT